MDVVKLLLAVGGRVELPRADQTVMVGRGVGGR